MNDNLIVQLIQNFQLAGVQLPDARTATDLFVAVKSSQSDPGQTIRLRLTPPLHAALAHSLTENLDREQAEQIQRLFHGASLDQVVTSPDNQECFLLTIQQTNLSQGQERPVRMLLALEQLEALGAAIHQMLERYRAPPASTH